MITTEQIRAILDFKGDTIPVTSLYLITDPRRVTATGVMTRLNSMFSAREKELANQDLTHLQQKSIQHDFRKIWEYLESLPSFSNKA